MHLLLADSGLGGLAVCAGVERRLREAGGLREVRLTYFNAAPASSWGYNDLPKLRDRVALLQRALTAMERLNPDRIVLACNTLSVLYERLNRRREGAPPVRGILEAGVRLFAEALAEDPEGLLLLLGTRTTIEAGAHRKRLRERGFPRGRMLSMSCHGLARAIEADPEGPQARSRIQDCAARLPALGRRCRRLFAALACTHYGFAARLIREAFEARAGQPVIILDPNERLAEEAADDAVKAAAPGFRSGQADIRVRVLSKIPLPRDSREAIAARLRNSSEAAAEALLDCVFDPDLF